MEILSLLVCNIAIYAHGMVIYNLHCHRTINSLSLTPGHEDTSTDAFVLMTIVCFSDLQSACPNQVTSTMF